MLRVSVMLVVCLVSVAVASNSGLTAAQAANLQNIFGGLSGNQGGGSGNQGGGLGNQGGGFGEVPCKKYCRKPVGRGYECCDHIKPGQCPPVRPSCPGVRTNNGPVYCVRDDYCSGDAKCCPDACIDNNLRVCKPPLFY
uniref:Crustin-like-10 protein n=1 Tax=Pagurus bernhardus TaxID=174397 RepID=W6MGZ1_PAGBR